MVHISPSEYMDYAPTVVGEVAHINHTSCSAGIDRKRRLYIKRTEDKVLAYCHNCGGKGIYHVTKCGITRSLSTLKSMYKEGEIRRVKKVELPKDAVFDMHDWPSHALTWVHKYGITPDMVKKHMVCYSPHMNRVVLPVFHNGDLVFWQARALKDEYPKYFSVSSVDKPLMFLRTTKSTAWVVVEDILSAIKCSEEVNAVALLGTSPSVTLAVTLRAEKASKIIIWLDGDVAGWKGKQKCLELLGLVLDTVRICEDKRQPKEVSCEEIADIIRRI